MTEQESAVLLRRRDGGVTEVVLNRPDKRNAFDDVIIQQLIHALTDVNADTGTRVVILRSEGKHFSAGADLAWMRRMACEPPTVNAVPPDRDRTAEAPAPGVSPAAERRNWPQQNIFRSGKMSKFGHGALCAAENGAEGTGAARARRPFSERRTHVSEFRPCHISGRGGTPSNNSPEGGGEWGTRQEITLRASDLSAAKSSASCSSFVASVAFADSISSRFDAEAAQSR